VLKRRVEIPNDISNLWRVNKVARGRGVVTDIIFVTGEGENLMAIDVLGHCSSGSGRLETEIN
jgi:predicted RNA-binding protein